MPAHNPPITLAAVTGPAAEAGRARYARHLGLDPGGNGASYDHLRARLLSGAHNPGIPVISGHR